MKDRIVKVKATLPEKILSWSTRVRTKNGGKIRTKEFHCGFRLRKSGRAASDSRRKWWALDKRGQGGGREKEAASQERGAGGSLESRG